jgi:hypothetical protein
MSRRRIDVVRAFRNVAAKLMSSAKFVGAGLLANAVVQSPCPYLPDRVRQQAGSLYLDFVF